MMEEACPKCKSKNYVKAGLVKAKQRYKCKACGYHFTQFRLGQGYDERTKKNALKLYLEGMGFRSIERVMRISHNTVGNWVRKAGKKNRTAHRAVGGV